MPGRGMGEVNWILFCQERILMIFIKRLAIDPFDNSILLFGARSGNGLWKSTDFGATWAKVSSFTNPGKTCSSSHHRTLELNLCTQEPTYLIPQIRQDTTTT